MKKKLLKLGLLALSAVSLLTIEACDKGYAKDETVQALEEKITALETKINGLDDKASKTALEDCTKELESLKELIESYKITELITKVTTLEETLTNLSSANDENKTAYYTVNIYDLDGELLTTKKLRGTGNDRFFDNLTLDFDVNYTESEYGHYLKSINGQIEDPNWYVAIYENGLYSEVGVDQLHIDDGDVFDFKVECWNTVESGYGVLDSYDVNVDKAIYHYAKTYLKDAFANATTYSDSHYWDNMIIYTMASNNYDKRLFNTDSFSNAYVESVKNADVSSLSGANIGKWFYAARNLGVDLDAFKVKYQEYLEGLTEYGSEYTMPFTTSPSVYLEMTNYLSNNVKNTTKRAGTNWGIDGLTWQIANLALFNDLDEAELEPFAPSDKGNGISTALCLLPYSALNKNVRNVKNESNKDLLQILFDTYYDSELDLIKWKTTDTKITGNSNQIYASLVAYKVNRDLGKKVSIFA
ncbi:MAG: DUF4430 domain-containing protein [Acholeplasmatales bacterium]|nr:DUF4430 domain-containing protein [Acholeplasmatales bacterium]